MWNSIQRRADPTTAPELPLFPPDAPTNLTISENINGELDHAAVNTGSANYLFSTIYTSIGSVNNMLIFRPGITVPMMTRHFI